MPASLSENTALRTLDLGHNKIENLESLRSLGIALMSLVQLTLAGNPLCSNDVSGGAPDDRIDSPDKDDDERQDANTAYITAIESMFRGLKVRDGKRILLKKSHTYSGSRIHNGHVTGARNDAIEQSGGGEVADRKGRGENDKRTKKPGGKEKTKKENGDSGKHVDTTDTSSVAARTGETDEAKDDESRRRKNKRKVGSSAKVVKKAKSTAAREEHSHRAKSYDSVKSVRGSELEVHKHGTDDLDTLDDNSKTVNGLDDASASEMKSGGIEPSSDKTIQKTQKVRNRSRQSTSASAAGKSSARAEYSDHKSRPPREESAEASGKNAKDETTITNYSSSEELPLPGVGKIKVHGVAETGVVAVVVNKKSQGGKASSNSDRRKKKAKIQRDGGRVEFSVEALLKARDGVGVGDGSSAWD